MPWLVPLPERGAILGRHLVDVVGGLEAAGARHVLRDELGIARNVATHMARQRARIDVIAAAGTKTDQQLDGFAGIKIRLRRDGRRRRERKRKQARAKRAMQTHLKVSSS